MIAQWGRGPVHVASKRARMRVWLLSLLSVASMASAGEPRAMVVATYAYPQRDRAAAIQPLADYLQQRLQRPVQVRVLPSPSELVRAIASAEVDVAVPNLHGYLSALQLGDAVASLPVPDVPPAQADRYRAVIIAREPLDDAGLRARAGGLRLVMVGRDSASGGFVPRRHLLDIGIASPERAFAQVDHAGSHAAALAALLEGRADVAALAADIYDAGKTPQLHEVWRSQAIPPGPLLCRRAAEVDCGVITGLLLDARRDDPRVMAALRAGWPEFGDAEGFVPADVPMLEKLGGQIAAD